MHFMQNLCFRLGCRLRKTRRRSTMAHRPAKAAGRVLAGMRPYSLVVSVCRVGRSVGVAISDPYLSCAAPLCTVPSARPLALQEALRSRPIGALLLGLPLEHRHRPHGRQRRLAALLRRTLGMRLSLSAVAVGRLPTIRAAPTALAEVFGKAHDAPELWSEVGLPDKQPDASMRLSPAVHAAATLQAVLDEEMGGWPNTFG